MRRQSTPCSERTVSLIAAELRTFSTIFSTPFSATSKALPMKRALLCSILLSLLAACSPTPTPTSPVATEIDVWKSPTCSCCSKWVEHLRGNGFAVNVHNETAMNPLKTKLGVPEALASCHTGVVEGYVIEGHVPAQGIRKLLADKPAARGLAVPGMPIGSPGMEQGERRDAYETVLFTEAGTSQTFAEHGNRTPAEPVQP